MLGLIPDGPQHDLGWLLATTHVLASEDFAAKAHAAIDRAAEAAHYDRTQKAEVTKKLAEYQRQEQVLRLAGEEALLAEVEAEAKRQREEFDRRGTGRLAG